MKYDIVKRLRRLCACLVGITFCISGILKLMDPVGAMLVVREYFAFFHIGFMNPAAKFFAVLFALAEAIIGTGLITGVWRKTFAVIVTAFQIFFTLLTLILVIWNPVMDCGCFGEAVHLSHLHTLGKNLILCALLAGAFIPFRNLGVPKKLKYVSFGIVSLSMTAFMIYSLLYIPLVDFTAYKTAASLVGREHNFEASFIYEKNGERREFDLDELPDSSWTFVETTVQNTEYEQNAVLSLSDIDGNYCDGIVEGDRILAVSVFDPGSVSAHKWNKIGNFVSEAQSFGFRPIIITTFGADIPENTIADENLYFSDYKTLISLNRSNGGITMINGGYIIKKWAYIQLPDTKELQLIHDTNITEILLNHSSKGKLAFNGFLLYVFAVLFLL